MLDAWLTFLGSDKPEDILELLNKYPYFERLYNDLYDMCRNVEGFMGIFSKELQILDQNTVKYMIDELQEKCDKAEEELEATKERFQIYTWLVQAGRTQDANNTLCDEKFYNKIKEEYDNAVSDSQRN